MWLKVYKNRKLKIIYHNQGQRNWEDHGKICATWSWTTACIHLTDITFHAWRYSPFRALASLKKYLNSSLFSALLLHPRDPSICSEASEQHCPYNRVVVYLPVPSEASLRFSQHTFFYGMGLQPHAQPPTWRTRLSLFVWVITFDLSGMGGPTSSFATAGLTLGILWPRKPHHYAKVETPSGGWYSISARK
jgi:hypothetical protein